MTDAALCYDTVVFDQRTAGMRNGCRDVRDDECGMMESGLRRWPAEQLPHLGLVTNSLSTLHTQNCSVYLNINQLLSLKLLGSLF